MVIGGVFGPSRQFSSCSMENGSLFLRSQSEGFKKSTIPESQMEKNEITKYLKGVILGCAHIIVFGRSSLSDMEIFSSLAGVRDVTEVQTSVTETALTDEYR